MPLGQAAEISVTKSDFLARLTAGDFDQISFGPALSDGTHLVAKVNGVWRAFLISDLVRSPFIVLIGKTSLTLGGSYQGQFAVNFTPALTDPLTRYNAFAQVDDAANFQCGRCRIVSATQLNVTLFRMFVGVFTTSTATGVTITGNDLTDVSGMTVDLVGGTVTGPHGRDVGGAGLGHGHTTTGHPVTDPTHQHQFNISLGSATANVDWMIIHV